MQELLTMFCGLPIIKVSIYSILRFLKGAKMNRLFKHLSTGLIALVLYLSLAMCAFAQGTTSISVSNSAPAVGDTVTINITASASGTVTVKYTASLLSLESCTASGYTADNNAIVFSGTEGDISFKATAGGTASIIVSSSACSGSSTTLSIGGTQTSSTDTAASGDTAAETAGDTADDSATAAEVDAGAVAASVGTLNESGGFDIGGVSYVVSERYSDSEIPSNFSKQIITIGSSTYNELSNGTITLLYLKPADNTSGSGVFYIYDEAAGQVSPFLMLGGSDNYVILSDPVDTLSSGLQVAAIDVTGGSYTAYTSDGSEFFYVYGTNAQGYTGWFLYDASYATVSRVDTSLISTTTVTAEDTADTTSTYDANDNYVSKLSMFRKIIAGLIVLAVVLIFVIINLVIRNRDNGDYIDFDEEEDFSEDEEVESKPKKHSRKKSDDDIFAHVPKKSAFKMPRSIVFADPDDEEDDDYDDEDYAEDDETYEEVSETKTTSASGIDMIDLNDM